VLQAVLSCCSDSAFHQKVKCLPLCCENLIFSWQRNTEALTWNLAVRPLWFTSASILCASSTTDNQNIKAIFVFATEINFGATYVSTYFSILEKLVLLLQNVQSSNALNGLTLSAVDHRLLALFISSSEQKFYPLSPKRELSHSPLVIRHLPPHSGCFTPRTRTDISVSRSIMYGFSKSLCKPATLSQAVLHRGILYSEMGKYLDALSDFEQALRFDHTLACAHVNIGLIHLQVSRIWFYHFSFVSLLIAASNRHGRAIRTLGAVVF